MMMVLLMITAHRCMSASNVCMYCVQIMSQLLQTSACEGIKRQHALGSPWAAKVVRRTSKGYEATVAATPATAPAVKLTAVP